jgi:hypothetical protein
MVDYVKLANTAKKLINANGREITFIGKSQAASDPSKPWDGPTGGTDISLVLDGVFVPPNTVRQFGLTALGQGTEYVDLISFSEEIIITFPGDNDLRNYIQVIDEVTYGIVGIQVLKPGPLNLLAFVGIRR